MIGENWREAMRAGIRAMEKVMAENLIERLRKIEALKPGDMVPPEMYDESGNWATLMSKLCGEAADEIERLQSMAGAVSEGQSFSDLKQSLRG